MWPSASRSPRSRRQTVAGEPTLRAFGLTLLLLVTPALATAQSWLPGGWAYRRPVAVANPGGTTLTNIQVKVTLPAGFVYAHAKADGSDLRVTTSDGTTALPFHLDLWNVATSTGRLYVKVPSLPAAGTTLYVYYGNPTASSVSNGDATYDFFDDFDGNIGLGYYPLGPSQTIMVKDQAWETEGPHTLSVVPAPAGASWTYYGYYGLEDCTGIGMAGSNDMVHWTKFGTNPLLSGGGERWPHVIKDGTTYHMVHTVNFCNVPSIARRTSTDGLTWSAPTTVVNPVNGRRNQNPNLWHDPNDGKFYLYWFEGDLATVWRIMARSATAMTGLASAPSVELLSSPLTLAAPNMMYRDGTYFLITEIFDTVWKVKVYGGPTPLGPFTELPGNPILGGDCACMFQHPVGNTIYEYYCKRNGSIWTLDLIQADASAGRVQAAYLDTVKWEPTGGTWSAQMVPQFDGVTGAVAEGSTPYYDNLNANLSGSDYAFESWGRLLEGRIFGIGVRMADADNGYTLNLYDDLDGTDNLYLYQWDNGNATEIWRAPVGTVNKNTWYKLKLKVSALGFRVWLNDSLRTPNWVGANPDIPNGMAALYLEDGTRAQFDDARVYHYAATDPTSSVGSEAVPGNTPPVAAITAPANGAFVSSAASVTLTSGATDAEDPTGSLTYRWDVRMLRSTGDSVVVHTATTRNSAFTPPVGDTATVVRYRIVHKVTDTLGASDSTSVTVWPEVNLKPAALSVSPVAPVGTDSLTFSFRLRNTGKAIAPRTRWRLTREGNVLVAEGDRAVPALDSTTVTVKVAAFAVGAHTVRVKADTLAALAETDEADNAATLAFTTAPNTPPVAGLNAPADGAFVPPGLPVTLNSTSHDAEDANGVMTYRWDVRMLRSTGDSVVVHTATARNSSFTPPAGDDSTVVRYRIVHRVTDTQGASDSTSVTVWPEVNLMPVALAVSPVAPVGTDSLTFSFRLRNTGRAIAPRTRWRLTTETGALLAEGDRAVAPLDSASLSVKVPALPVGPHTVRVTADTLAALRETDESDDATVVDFTTAPNGSPVAAIVAPAPGAFVSPAAAVPLTSGSTDAEDATGALTYRWDVRIQRADGDSVALASATTRDASFTPPVGDDSTIVRYRIVHRATDTQGASDSTSLLVWPEVDLTPVALAVSPAAPVGSDSLTFTFRLRNDGRAVAPRTRWRLTTETGALLAEGDQAVAGLDSVSLMVKVGPLAAGAHTVRVTADTLAALHETDEDDDALALSFVTTPNAAPTAAVAGLVDGASVAPAQPVALTSAASDAQDPPALLQYHWDVYRYARAARPAGPPPGAGPGLARAGRAALRDVRSAEDSVVVLSAGGASAAFTPIVGDDSTFYRYRVVHRVTDTQGLSDSVSLALFPEVQLRPDALRLWPGEPRGIDSLQFTFAIHNEGAAWAPRTRWRLTVDDTLWVAESDAAVAPHDSVVITLPLLSLPLGTYVVRVEADADGELHETNESDGVLTQTYIFSGEVAVDPGKPAGPRGVSLSVPYPNPTRGNGATLELALGKAARVDLAVYDVSGRRVRRLLAEALPAGARRVWWDGRSDAGEPVPAGIYLVRLHSEDTVVGHRLMVLR